FDYHPVLLAGRESVKVANMLYEQLMNHKIEALKFILWQVITKLMLGSGKIWLMVLGAGIKIFRGVSFLKPYVEKGADYAGEKLTTLQIEGQRLNAKLEYYKWRLDQFYNQHEEVVEKYFPMIEKSKKEFDEWWATESEYLKMAL